MSYQHSGTDALTRIIFHIYVTVTAATAYWSLWFSEGTNTTQCEK